MNGQSGAGRITRFRADGAALVDEHLERVIIASCLFRPHFLIDVDLTEGDFYGPAHQLLWRAIVRIYADDGAVDTNRLRAHLLDLGQLVRVGGDSALQDLTDSYIEAPPLPTARLKRLAIQRRLRNALELYAANLLEQEAADKYAGEVDKLRRELELLDASRPAAVAHRFDSMWLTVAERGSLAKVPDPRRWLLTRPDDESNGMANPIGVLPLGKTGLLVAQGGSGKTIALIQLAISVATGRRWLDYFHVGKPSRVLLALAEEDGEELDRRIYDLCSAMRLTDTQRALVGRNVVALGLSGEVTSLVTQDGRETIETDVLTYFRRRLGEGEWSLVVLDTLTRFAGGDTEKDSAQATRFIQAAESLCKAPGSPTVLIAHHTNKISRQEGAATSASNSRGSSALTDGARWVANLEATSDESVKLTVTKSNYAMPAPPVMLVRDSHNGGCLSVESPEVARQRAALAAAAHEQAIWDATRLRIAAALEKHPGLRSRGEVATKAGGRKSASLAVLKDLIEAGEVAQVEGVYRFRSGGKT